MAENKRLIAVCGVDCAQCPLLNADTDAGAARNLVPWFRKEGWLKEDEDVTEIMQRGPYCQGCRGDRSVHWSSDCWILECCADDKGLEFCYQCDVFPCDRLSEWAEQNTRYTAALNRLGRMKIDIAG
ncbi:MAG: DUF3795 domain-containing protein [Candidatus Adiutricales bacterium]